MGIAYNEEIYESGKFFLCSKKRFHLKCDCINGSIKIGI